MATARELELASYKDSLIARSESKCECCGATDGLAPYAPEPVTALTLDACALLCPTCTEQLNGADVDEKHWLCLNEAGWSQIPAIQVIALRMLERLSQHSWAADLNDQLYIEEDVRKWAEAGMGGGASVETRDSNGVLLQEGDTVTVIKDLDVKGTSFVAKRGTVVKNIRITGNGEHVEGKVNGTVIFLKSDFIKKI